MQIPYSYRAPVSLDTEIKADSWVVGLDVVEIWTFQIQECCEGPWHDSVKGGDHCVRNTQFLVVVAAMVRGVHINNVRASDGCMDWQLGIDVQVLDSDLAKAVPHGC